MSALRERMAGEGRGVQEDREERQALRRRVEQLEEEVREAGEGAGGAGLVESLMQSLVTVLVSEGVARSRDAGLTAVWLLAHWVVLLPKSWMCCLTLCMKPSLSTCFTPARCFCPCCGRMHASVL